MTDTAPVALITGGAKRIGAALCRQFHSAGHNIVLHYHQSTSDAEAVADALNEIRAHSCLCLQADLSDDTSSRKLAADALQHFGRVDVLINNASLYFTSGETNGEDEDSDWNTLVASNLRAPWVLTRALQAALSQSRGSVLNLIDAQSQRYQPGYAIYDMTKNALHSLTLSLARELAPDVRVNGISPGLILWPETRDQALTAATQQSMLDAIPLGRIGDPKDIAELAVFLTTRATYISGQVIAVDGGLSLT